MHTPRRTGLARDETGSHPTPTRGKAIPFRTVNAPRAFPFDAWVAGERVSFPPQIVAKRQPGCENAQALRRYVRMEPIA
jgi:hypothetical protein